MTLSRREMFSGTAAMLGAAWLAHGNTALAEGGEYMFAPGLIYLNTGSLGPTPRSIYDEVLKAWTGISPHVFNTEADIDAALKAIASELA